MRRAILVLALAGLFAIAPAAQAYTLILRTNGVVVHETAGTISTQDPPRIGVGRFHTDPSAQSQTWTFRFAGPIAIGPLPRAFYSLDSTGSATPGSAHAWVQFCWTYNTPVKCVPVSL